MKNLKATLSLNKNGITLIALVITIIILLILAGVTINVLLGENGLFNTAKNAGEEYNLAGIREKVETEILNLDMEKVLNGETLTVEEVLVKTLENKTFEAVDIEQEIGFKDGYEILLGYNEHGKVVILDMKKK